MSNSGTGNFLERKRKIDELLNDDFQSPVETKEEKVDQSQLLTFGGASDGNPVTMNLTTDTLDDSSSELSDISAISSDSELSVVYQRSQPSLTCGIRVTGDERIVASISSRCDLQSLDDRERNLSDSTDFGSSDSLIAEDEAVLDKSKFLGLIARLRMNDNLSEEFVGIYSKNQEKQDSKRIVEELIELTSKFILERRMAKFVPWEGSDLQEASLALKEHIDDSGRLKLKWMIIDLIRDSWNSMEMNLHVAWERQLLLLSEFCFDSVVVTEVLNYVIHSLSELTSVVNEPVWKLEERGVSLMEKCFLFVDFARSLARKFKEIREKPSYSETLRPWIIELRTLASSADKYYPPVSTKIQALVNDLSSDELRNSTASKSITTAKYTILELRVIFSFSYRQVVHYCVSMMGDAQELQKTLSHFALLTPIDIKSALPVSVMLETLSEAVISVDKEPGVIDNEMILSAYMKNVPADTEPGKLMHAEGVKFGDIEVLKLEFYDILRIDHLWMCCNLRILSLSNNIIEELTNLESLVNLEELNLSFNRIKEITGLRALTKLENLSLFNNRISKLENLEGQFDSLRILSVGRNLIESSDCLAYLRKFSQLRSLNLEGNPFLKLSDDRFPEMVAGMLPRLVYYNYRMLTTDERQRGREKLKKKLKHLEEEEENYAQWKKELQIQLDKVDHYQKAFIEGYDKWDFFNKLMNQDHDGQLLMKVSDDVLEVFTTLKDTLTNISKNILTLGIQCYGHRQNEQKVFHHNFTEAMEASVQESQVVTRDFVLKKNKILEKLQANFERPCLSEGMAVKNMKACLLFDKDFTFVRRKAWWDLMEKEMKRFEGNEERLSDFEDKMIKLIGKFREKIQEEFGKMRDAENEFYEALADQINKFLVELHGKEERSAIPDNLKKVLFHKENLNNSIGSSHENHLLTIDTSEEKMLEQLNSWQVQLAARLYRDEVRRNRNEVLEIDRFLSFHKADWERQVGEQIKAAFSYMSTVDPEWSHEIMRLKMNQKERLLDDQMQAMMSERMQQSLKVREEDRLEEVEERRRLEHELEEESEDHLKRSTRRKRQAQLPSESKRPVTFLDEEKERESFSSEDEMKGSVRKLVTRFAYRCLIKTDTQSDTIYQHWSSAEDLS